MWITRLEGGGAAGQDHDVGELGGEAEAGGSPHDSTRTVSLDKGLRDEAAGPGRRNLNGRRGAHDATFPFHKKTSRPQLPPRLNGSFDALRGAPNSLRS
jgi:hypothetical protein